MAEVLFNYEGTIKTIQCNINDKMDKIIDKFLILIEKGDDNNIYFLYNGSKIKNDLSFIEQANELDKTRKKMNVIAIDNNTNKNEIKLIISKDIICPECQENILLDIKDFKINLKGCKNNHIQNNILLKLFPITQQIDLSTIICDICKESNKSNTHNNDFYICNTCNINICPLCKLQHDKEHLIIKYDDKNYKCNIHNDFFIKHCKTCNIDICLLCENKHNVHDIQDFSEIVIDKDELIKINKELKNAIDKFKNKINIIIEIFNKMKNIMDIYYKINDNFINNYNINKRNYYNLQNIKYLKNNNEILIKDLNNIIKNDNFLDIYEFSINNFYNDNGEKYIGEMKNFFKEGKGILFYNKNDNRKKYEGEFKNDKKEGKGIMYWNDGDRYEGDWKNDKKEGKGKYYWNNESSKGNKYEGDFKNDRLEGKGIFYWNEGDRYEGDLAGDKREGKGVKFYKDGNRYEGDWKNDKKEGKGIMYYKDGNRYEGNWKNGNKEGKGIMYYKDGKKEEGYWKNDKLEKKGSSNYS